MKIKLLPKKKQLASTLLTTLFICSLLGLSTMGYLALVEYQNRLSFRSQSWNLAIALVEAGVEEGLQHLNTNTKNLNSEGWILNNGNPFAPTLTRTRPFANGSYTVFIDATDISFPSVTSSATINVSPIAMGRRSTLLAVLGVNGDEGNVLNVSRAVRVHCYKGGLFPNGIVTKDGLQMNGNNVTVDSFRSCDPGYPGSWNSTLSRSKGNIATNGKVIDVGNANIYGHAATGPGGTVNVGNNGEIGDKDWLAAHPDINKQPGYITEDSNFTFPDTTFPFSSGFDPGPGDVITANVNTNGYSTNTTAYPSPPPSTGVITNTTVVTVTTKPNPEPAGLTTNAVTATAYPLPSPTPSGTITTNTTVTTTTAYPASGTYSGNVTTNVSSTTVSSYPAPGTYQGTVTTNTAAATTTGYPSAGSYVGSVTTNTASTTTSGAPGAGTYIGSVTTNTTSTTSSSYPAAGTYTGTVSTNTSSTPTTTTGYPAPGTYVGSVTTNYNAGGKKITGYSYNLITRTYAYAKITGYTYNKINNYSYTQVTGYTFTKINSYTYNKINTYTYVALSYSYTTYTYTYQVIATSTSYSTNHYDHVLYSGDYYATSLSGKTIVLGDARLVMPNGLSTTDLKIASGAKLQVFSGGTSFSLAGNQVLNVDGTASSFIVYCAPTVTSVSLSGNAAFVGVIVAPNAAISLNGGGNNTLDFIGAIIAKSMTSNGHFNMHYDECLAEVPANGRYLITQWDEIPPLNITTP